MDGENAALRKRLSSILKSGRVRGTEEDDRTDEIINQRRVSFASKSSVKPFTYDAEANNTIWDATYEEAAIQSDQSTIHTTADSAVHMSIEVSNICQLHPQQVQSSSRADPLNNMTCVNMDEDIEIEADDIQFAPVRQTRIHNPKFAIFEDDSAKLKTADDKPIQNSFINPLLIKENTRTNIDDVLLGKEQGKEDNMQLESNIELNKTTASLDALKQCNYNLPMDIVNNVEDKDFDLNSCSPGTAMNFTIHEVKTLTNKSMEKKTVPQKSNRSIEEDGDMEFTTVILTKPLQENLPRKEVESDDCGYNVMDVTMNSVPSNRKLIVDCDMEFTTVIPKNVLKVKFNHNVEDGDMEFTKDIPAVLLEQLRLKMQAEDKNNQSLLDDLIIDDDASSPLNCSQQYKISDKENMDLTMISKNVRCSGKDNKSSFDLKTDSNVEDRTQEVRPQIVCSYAEQQDIVQCVSKGRDSSYQFDGSFHTNPTSEVDDTQYLINYKSHICKGSPLSTSETGKGAATNFQICEEDSLQNKLPVLKIAEIPNVVTVPENLSQTDQSCKKKEIPITAEVEEDIIPNFISNNDNCFELSAAVNDRTKIDEIALLTNQHEIQRTESFPVQKNDLNTANVFDKLTNRSEIDVFKPSSKNNTRCSFFESMEIGTPYISVIEESNDKIIDQMDESLLKVMPKVHCYETDKIIFASESSCSLELEEAPEKAFGNLRRSLYGIAEGHVVPTHMSTQEMLAKTLYNPEETLCQEDIPILDDSHVDIHFDSAELAENVSASTIAFYNSNEDSKIDDSSNDNIQASSASPIVHTPEDPASNNRIPLSYLPNISPNCSIDQLYDLLGWSADDMPREVPLPPRISAEEKEKQRAMQQMTRLAEEKGIERLAQYCREMVETVAQIDRENAIRSAEDLARSQGRTLRPQTVEEWLKHQRKTQSTLWSLKSLTNDNCEVSSRFTQFHLKIEPDSFVITSTTVQNIADSKSVTKLSQLIRKLFIDKTQESQIQSAIGTKYNLRTFLEYLQMKLDDVVKIEREFLKIFRKLLVEARLSFDDNLILQYLLIGRSRWLIKINCFDINNLSQNSICEMITLAGDFRVPEKEIKKIARKCPRGLSFLSSFVDDVYEFRNMRERTHCLDLNELLNKMETKIGKL